MKPRNREVNIFNMSVLDLLTGALGAFCFLTLALFPYYFKFRKLSAAEGAEEAKATEALKAIHVKLERELASVKTNQHGIPPFAMAFLTMSDPRNSFCSVFRIINASGPGGKAAIRLLPNGIKEGGDVNLNLFLFAPGAYVLSVEANPDSMPCTFVLVEYGATGSHVTTTEFQRGTTSYDLKFEVQPADLQFAQTFKQ